MAASGVVKMFAALADYVGTVHGGDDGLFNGILDAAHEALSARGAITDPDAEALLLELLQRPLQVPLPPACVLALNYHLCTTSWLGTVRDCSAFRAVTCSHCVCSDRGRLPRLDVAQHCGLGEILNVQLRTSRSVTSPC